MFEILSELMQCYLLNQELFNFTQENVQDA